MRCPRCDANVNDTHSLCTYCGQDLSVIHYVKRVSNTYYNIGLEKAHVRDLSGAIVILKKSLQFDKKNTQARNLLGLIYYEMGETVAALSEWVLSKYLQPEDNIADEYINTIQKNQTALDATNQTIKKYNAALSAAKAGNEDLAIIQLRKVVNINPHFVRAQHLLALLYIHIEDYQKAAKCLNRVRHIDYNNTTTLRYMSEIGKQVEENNKIVTQQKKKKDPLANVTPVGSYKEEKRSILPGVYMVIGAVIGIIVSFVLIRPTINQSGLSGGSDISDANNQVAVQESQISALEKERDSLKNDIAKLKKQIADGDTEALQKLDKYDRLTKAMKLYQENQKIDAAVELVGCKKEDYKSAEAKDMYSKIGILTDAEINALVNQGRNQMYSSYDTALETFKKVLKLAPKNQTAMLWTGRCYQQKNDAKKAKKWYDKAIKVDANSNAGRQAKAYLEQMTAQP